LNYGTKKNGISSVKNFVELEGLILLIPLEIQKDFIFLTQNPESTSGLFSCGARGINSIDPSWGDN